MADGISIEQVLVERIIDLRWRILRAGLERETAYFDGDHEPTTHHIAAMAQGKVVGCATILQRPWQEKPAWQMRGMAVEPSIQRSGVGRMLLAEIDRMVAGDPHSRQLWCNARVPAVGFYQKLGWAIASEQFVIPTAGPHVKMTKGAVKREDMKT